MIIHSYIGPVISINAIENLSYFLNKCPNGHNFGDNTDERLKFCSLCGEKLISNQKNYKNKIEMYDLYQKFLVNYKDKDSLKKEIFFFNSNVTNLITFEGFGLYYNNHNVENKEFVNEIPDFELLLKHFKEDKLIKDFINFCNTLYPDSIEIKNISLAEC